MKRRGVGTLSVLGLSLVLSGCAAVTKLGTTVGVATGKISDEQKQTLDKSSEKASEKITPEQEYYIGRSVAATLLTTYKPFNQEAATRYLNILGQTLAQASAKPETFGGYHFSILDTEEINAFAAPGGLIVVSKGLLRCCRNEDALAAVLAHEVGHVEREHGLNAIEKGRKTAFMTTLAVTAGKSLGGTELADLTKAFEGTIGDITNTMVNSGYSRQSEFEADAAAVRILRSVGYNPEGLVDMLEQMQKKLQPGSHGFGATHPAPKDRIEAVRKLLGAATVITEPAARKQRFSAAVAKL
jgi:predicted Zn-dependent protease